VGPLKPRTAVEDPYDARMKVTVDGFEPVITLTSHYLHRAPTVIAALSQFATLQPGDIISLGRAGEMVTIPADRPLSATTNVVAEIADIGQVAASIKDRRRRLD
jgi:2-keto-4-pentenoate hydratase/2-oxohepta-3-ene-1,7-dioic acid hydratase in catechol pathway